MKNLVKITQKIVSKIELVIEVFYKKCMDTTTEKTVTENYCKESSGAKELREQLDFIKEISVKSSNRIIANKIKSK